MEEGGRETVSNFLANKFNCGGNAIREICAMLTNCPSCGSVVVCWPDAYNQLWWVVVQPATNECPHGNAIISRVQWIRFCNLLSNFQFQELFKRLIPHQCLGAVWSGKDKQEAPSVLATVNQFNAVSFRVISSVLIEPRLKPQVSERRQFVKYCIIRSLFASRTVHSSLPRGWISRRSCEYSRTFPR